MSRGLLGSVLIGTLAWGLGWPAVSVAAGPFALLERIHHPPAPDFQGNPQIISMGTPGPYRDPQYSTGNYPWYGYGFGVAAYRWGYFGARSRPVAVSHQGYYGTFTQWGYRRGY